MKVVRVCSRSRVDSTCATSTLPGGSGGVGQFAFDHVLDHFQSTREGESGILVDVHPAELLKDAEWVAPSSLSDSVRMDSNNVLKHHS